MLRWRLRRLRRSHTLRWVILVIAAASLLDTLAARNVVAVTRVPIVVAARDVAAGEIVDRSSLAVVEVELGALAPEGALSDPDSIVGHVALDPLYVGEPVRPERISGTTRRGPAALLDVGERAISIPLAADHGLRLAPGDVVSVFSARSPIGDGPAVVVVSAGQVLEQGERSMLLAVAEDEAADLAAALAEVA